MSTREYTKNGLKKINQHYPSGHNNYGNVHGGRAYEHKSWNNGVFDYHPNKWLFGVRKGENERFKNWYEIYTNKNKFSRMVLICRGTVWRPNINVAVTTGSYDKILVFIALLLWLFSFVFDTRLDFSGGGPVGHTSGMAAIMERPKRSTV